MAELMSVDSQADHIKQSDMDGTAPEMEGPNNSVISGQLTPPASTPHHHQLSSDNSNSIAVTQEMNNEADQHDTTTQDKTNLHTCQIDENNSSLNESESTMVSKADIVKNLNTEESEKIPSSFVCNDNASQQQEEEGETESHSTEHGDQTLDKVPVEDEEKGNEETHSTDEELQAPEEEMSKEKEKEDRVSISPARKSKSSARTLSYSSIIRTRRTKTQDDNKNIQYETKTNVDTATKAEQTENTPSSSKVEESDKSDDEDKNKSKGGASRGGRGRLRRQQKTVVDNNIKQSSVGPTAAAGNNDTDESGGRGTVRSKVVSPPAIPLTRAATAGMKAVQFLQLPRQQKKRRRGGKSEDESDDVESKKAQEEEEELEEEEMSGGEEDEEMVSKTAMPLKSSSKRGRGRGRGRRGRGGGARVDASVETGSICDEEEISASGNKKRKRKDSETDNDERNKQRRGRPKRLKDEVISDTPSVASPLKTDESTGRESMETEQEEQIKNQQQLEETGNLTDAASIAEAVANEIETENKLNDKPLQTVQSNEQQQIPKDDNKTPPTSEQQPAAQLPLSESSMATPISSQAPPTTAVSMDYATAYPRYPIDDQGYPPFPTMHPHSCLTIGYPPFSASPYHTFLLPTSPHFPYTTPQDIMPPHPQLYFPTSDPFSRYPPQTTSAPPVGIVTSTQSNDNKVSISSTEQPSMTTPANPTHPTTPTISSPIPHTIGLPLTYPPPPPAGYPMPPYAAPPAMINPTMTPLIADWNMTHQISAPGAPPPPPPPPAPPRPPVSSVKPKESRFPLNLLSSEDSSTTVGNPVDCPECGRHFKNNKALNGHMRLHGGFDWTRRVCRPYVVSGPKKDENNENSTVDGTTDQANTQTKPEKQAKRPPDLKQPIKVESKENNSRHHIATLDDLCRAAEELERIERDELNSKTRPTPLVLPHEKRINSFSPPYTPPPILSPARSLVLLSGSSANTGPIATPNKIWPQRKGSESKGGIRELDETLEPKINIGKDFQADIPLCKKANMSDHNATLVWKPIDNLSQEDEDTIDGYLELACSPAIPHNGRNKELALHLLKGVNGSVKEAVKLLVIGKSLLTPEDIMSNYNYTGSRRWSRRERQQFRRAWRVHRKQFNMIQSVVESKSLMEIIEYYYSWKKYCPDEYRGRNRHISDEILSEDDEIIDRPMSAASNSSGSNNDADQHHLDDSTHFSDVSLKSSVTSVKSRLSDKQNGNGRKSKSNTSFITHSEARDSHYNYGNQNVALGPAPVQEYRCKYPGCNQVYTSIFALNGHIRIHGGSWYPKKPDVENMHSGRDSSPSTSSDILLRGGDEDRKDEELRKNLEIAKTMVMDLPQPRSPGYSLGGFTPSPKASPNRGKSSLVKSKKACSSSPADREGHYPCNRCGRVFPKVKSRSAHMKSHIIKQIH